MPASKISVSVCGHQLGSLPLANSTTFGYVSTPVFRALAEVCTPLLTFESANGGSSGIAIDLVGVEQVERDENVFKYGASNQVPHPDFSGYSNSALEAGTLPWKRTYGTGIIGFAGDNKEEHGARSGTYMWMRTVSTIDTSVMQNVTVEGGGTYVLRWLAASRLGPGSNPAFPIPPPFNVSICGMIVAGNVVEPSFHFNQSYSAPLTIIGKSLIQCEIGFTILRGNSNLSDLLLSLVELMFIPWTYTVPLGTFEGLTDTNSLYEMYPGSIGSWTSGGHDSGGSAIVKLPGLLCDNLRHDSGWYVLWMQSTTQAPSASISVPVTALKPGATYVVRWLFARRKLNGIVFNAPSLSVNIFRTTVATDRIPASDVFTADQSLEFVAAAAGTMLNLTLSTDLTIKHILIDNVNVVMVKREPEADSYRFTGHFYGTFETDHNLGDGQYVTFSDLVSVNDQTYGKYWIANATSGIVAIVKTPSPTFLEGLQAFGQFALWMQSGRTEISIQTTVNSIYVWENHLYRLRWHQAIRSGGRHPLLRFRVNICGQDVWQTPATTEFYSVVTSDVFVGKKSCEMKFIVPAQTDEEDRNIIIDDVAYISLQSPIIGEFEATSTSGLTKAVRYYTHPISWATLLDAGSAVDITSMSIERGRLYTGMSVSSPKSTCHVLEYNTSDGTYVGAKSMNCNGGSVHSIATNSDQLYAGHERGVLQVGIDNSTSQRTFEWSFGSKNSGSINDVVVNSAFIVASSDDQTAHKWLVRDVPVPTKPPIPDDVSGALTMMQLVLIGTGCSVTALGILGAFLYVRRKQQIKARLGDYEMGKSREALRRSEMELGSVTQAMPQSQTSLGEIKSTAVLGKEVSCDGSRGTIPTMPQVFSNPVIVPSFPTKPAPLAQGPRIFPVRPGLIAPGPMISPNSPAKPVPVTPPFTKVLTTPPLTQNDRPLPTSATGGKQFSPSNDSSPRYRMPSDHSSSSQLMMATQRSASSRTTTSHTTRSFKRMTLLSQVVSDYHNRRSLESTMRSGQADASTMLTRRSDRTNVTQRTLVDQADHGLEIPGFLQLDEGADYQVDNEFASGGGGSLFRGHMLAQIISGMRVVVKKVTSTNLPAFRQEVALMWLFHDNDNMVKLIGFNESLFEIVMPEYRMGSLEQFITKNSYTSSIACSLALDVARGIMAMHKLGIVHQDIKTDNVLLEEHSMKRVNAVITDFGISNVVEDRVLKVKAFEVKNVRGLTARYAAPEAIYRYRQKIRTPVPPSVAKAGDVYSLAVVIYTLLMKKGRL